MNWRRECRPLGILVSIALMSLSGCAKPPEPGLIAEDKTVRVEILSVKVDELEYQTKDRRFRLNPTPGKKNPHYLQVTVDITNKTENRKINYTGWGEEGFPSRRATLVDEFKNNYTPKLHASQSRLVAMSIVGHHIGTLYPGDSINDVLIFEVPVDNAEVLTMELPKSSYDEKEAGSLILKFPADPAAFKELKK